jgi:hypothetical protein
VSNTSILLFMNLLFHILLHKTKQCSGPIGRDLGLALTFPICCMIAHGLKGQQDANQSIDNYVNSIIDTYFDRMVKAGKTAEEQAKILRNVVGTCGMFIYEVFYVIEAQISNAPVDTEHKAWHRDTNGILGLKLMRLGFDTDAYPVSTGYIEIRELFDSLREEEVSNAYGLFASLGRTKQSRKFSMLRAMNRRISDTEMLYAVEEAVKRFSLSVLKE